MFDSLRRLFRRGDAPAPVVQVPGLGELRWSEDDEAWRFPWPMKARLSHRSGCAPMRCRVLGDPALLANSIVRAKAEASVAIRLATLAR